MRLGKIWRAGAAISFGLGLGFLLLEILLRFVPTALPPEIHPQIAQKPWLLASVGIPQFFAEYRLLWEEDDLVREHMKPGLDTVIHGNPEYPAWPIRTSSLGLGEAGYRDVLPPQKPFALVLGDSYGFGVGVRQEEVWMERLERETGLPFINLSQVGASSLQEARIYSRDGRRLPVEVVIWMFFQNDMKENLRFAQWLDPAADIVQAARQPVQSCASLPHRALKKYSLTYELLIYWARYCQYSAIPPTPVYRDEDLSLTFCLDHDICDPEVQARMLSDGWPLTRQAVYDTLALVRQGGAELVIVIVPSKEQVYFRQFQAVASLPPGYDIDDVDQLVAPMRALCAGERLPCIDLTPAFREAANTGPQLYFPVDIHWNAQGQALVARVVGDYLRQAGLLP
ncbi:MAG: hypothetical protein ACE5H9_08280 [Anaerolineae bacterium]